MTGGRHFFGGGSLVTLNSPTQEHLGWGKFGGVDRTPPPPALEEKAAGKSDPVARRAMDLYNLRNHHLLEEWLYFCDDVDIPTSVDLSRASHFKNVTSALGPTVSASFGQHDSLLVPVVQRPQMVLCTVSGKTHFLGKAVIGERFAGLYETMEPTSDLIACWSLRLEDDTLVLMVSKGACVPGTDLKQHFIYDRAGQLPNHRNVRCDTAIFRFDCSFCRARGVLCTCPDSIRLRLVDSTREHLAQYRRDTPYWDHAMKTMGIRFGSGSLRRVADGALTSRMSSEFSASGMRRAELRNLFVQRHIMSRPPNHFVLGGAELETSVVEWGDERGRKRRRRWEMFPALTHTESFESGGDGLDFGSEPTHSAASHERDFEAHYGYVGGGGGGGGGVFDFEHSPPQRRFSARSLKAPRRPVLVEELSGTSSVEVLSSGEKQDSCYDCQRAPTSTTESSADTHDKADEPFSSDGGLRCTKCGVTFTRAYDTKRHIQTVHEKQKEHPCPYCPKMFSQRGHLNMHQRAVHSRDSAIVCALCNKSFKWRSNYLRHLHNVHGQLSGGEMARAADS